MPTNRVSPDGDQRAANRKSSTGKDASNKSSTSFHISVKSLTSIPSVSQIPSHNLVAAKQETNDPFIRLPVDLSGLIISGWLVPSVKSPFRGALAFVLTLLLQACFIGYIINTLVNEWVSPCSTPALIQLAAVYTFGAACFSQFTAFQGMQIAFHATHLKSDEHGEQQYLVRETPFGMRVLLLAITLTDLAVELVVLGVGVVFLMTSASPVDVVLNSVAVNFITGIDEIMLAAFVNKAAQQRLEKYRFNVKVGVDEGDTRLSHANRATKLQSKIVSRMPAVWGMCAVAIVGVGQGLAMQEPGTNCTLIGARYGASE